MTEVLSRKLEVIVYRLTVFSFCSLLGQRWWLVGTTLTLALGVGCLALTSTLSRALKRCLKEPWLSSLIQFRVSKERFLLKFPVSLSHFVRFILHSVFDFTISFEAVVHFLFYCCFLMIFAIF